MSRVSLRSTSSLAELYRYGIGLDRAQSVLHGRGSVSIAMGPRLPCIDLQFSIGVTPARIDLPGDLHRHGIGLDRSLSMLDLYRYGISLDRSVSVCHWRASMSIGIASPCIDRYRHVIGLERSLSVWGRRSSMPIGMAPLMCIGMASPCIDVYWYGIG